MRSNMINPDYADDKEDAQNACASTSPASATARRQALYLSLAQVPSGCVVSYGQLAAMAGLGRAARWVGRTLSQLPADSNLPWHRVITANGHLSLAPDTPSGEEQRLRLRNEGIQLSNNKVDMRRHGWRP
jgi:methylated-DNA-protein-cysteine methyltransferase-like protein